MLIGNCLIRNACRNPDGIAVSFCGSSLTWQQLLRRIFRLGNVMVGKGIAPGDAVVVILDNRSETIEAQLACMMIGAVLVPVMPGAVAVEVAHILHETKAKLAICEARFADSMIAADVEVIVVGNHGDGPDAYAALLEGASDSDPGVLFDVEAPAMIRYTSGTTGVPKGCVASHAGLGWAAAGYLVQMPFFAGERGALSSPLAAGLGIAMLHVYVCAGISMYLLRKFDPAALVQLVESERVTRIYAVETMLNALTRLETLATADLSSLKFVYGNSPGKDAAEGFRRLLANPSFSGKFYNAYGSTEAGGSVTFNLPEDIDQSLGDGALAHRTESIGRAAPFCRIDCVDEVGLPVPAGEVGELVISTPSAFKGYHNLPDETAQVLRGGRLFSGDLAWKSEDGFIYLAGRKREMIKSGGMNVYPAEVERILTSHPLVYEAAVVGVPDDRWGEMVVAFVVADPGCSAETLSAHCAANLAGYKRPKRFDFLSEFPKGSTGKIQKRELRNLAMAG